MSDNPSSPAPKPAAKVPLGPALAWTDDDLARLSEITPEDIELARAATAKVSPLLAGLLGAEAEEEEEVNG
jgi:hypothetical protein